jgi:hypothetical protein
MEMVIFGEKIGFQWWMGVAKLILTVFSRNSGNFRILIVDNFYVLRISIPSPQAYTHDVTGLTSPQRP